MADISQGGMEECLGWLVAKLLAREVSTKTSMTYFAEGQLLPEHSQAAFYRDKFSFNASHT